MATKAVSTGFAIARGFAEAGASVIVNDLFDERARAGAAASTEMGATAVAAPLGVEAELPEGSVRYRTFFVGRRDHSTVTNHVEHGQITEKHRCGDGVASRRIRLAAGSRHRVAACVEPLDRCAGPVERPARNVGPDSTLRAQIRKAERRSMKRTLLDGNKR